MSEDKKKGFIIFEELFATPEGRKEYLELVERSKRHQKNIDDSSRIKNPKSLKVPCGI